MYRRPLVVIVTLLALTLVGSAAALGESQPAVNTYTGTLTVIVGDPMPVAGEPMTPVPPIFTLHLADGGELPLLPGAAGENELLRLAGRRVSITVPAAEAEAALAADDAAAAGVPVASAALAPGAVMVSPEVSGNTKWLSIACKFADVVDEPQPLSYFQQMYGSTYPGLDHYWREASYDTINLAGSTAVGWYTLPQPRSYYVLNDDALRLNTLFDDCAAAADADVYFPDYYGISLFLNANTGCCQWSGPVYPTLDGVYRRYEVTWIGARSNLSGSYERSVLLHEMGHSYNWPHSWAGTTPQGDRNPYGNVWDVASGNRYNCDAGSPFIDPTYGCLGQHTITNNRLRTGWIPETRVYTAGPGRHTIRLERTAQPGPDGYLMAIVPIDDSGVHYYTVEARRRVGYDAKLPGDAVIIHETTDGFNMKVVDPGDGIFSDTASAMWLPGESYGSPEGIIIRVDAMTATGFTVTIFNGNTQSRTVALAPTADTYVQESTPAVNYGSAAQLKVKNAAPVTFAALKFDLAAVPPGAFRLRLRLSPVANPALAAQSSVYYAWPPHCRQSASWSETTLRWTDFAWGNCRTYAIAATPTVVGNWVEWDVTEGAFLYGVEDFLITTTSDLLSFSSREGANPPQLIVDYWAPLEDEPTTHTFAPTNDATVSQAKPKLVSGGKPTLQVKDAAKDLNAYVKFNVTGLDGAVQSATLRLWVTNGGPDGGRVYATAPFYPGTTTQWLETGLKWSNAPAINGAPLAAADAVTAGQWIELDVTGAVTGNGRASFALTNDSANLVVYSSKEGAHAPELVIVTD